MCTERAVGGGGTISLGKVGYVHPNLDDHHSYLESFIKHGFLCLTLRDSREDLGEALETSFLK